MLNETHFQAGRKVQLNKYASYSRNRNDKAAGGISTSVLNNDAPSCIRVAEGKDDNEFIVTRHSQFETPVNIINLYGQQECRLSREKVDKHWEEILIEINKIEERNELVVVAGDFNRHLGLHVLGKPSKSSHGGELVNDFLESGNYILLNNTAKTIGGPWTRVDPSDEDNKSILDFVIISKELEKYVQQMEIDKCRRFTAFRRNKNNSITYPDHYGISVKFRGIPLKSKQKKLGKNYIVWNTNKPGGWRKYEELTANNTKLDQISEDSTEDVNVIMNVIESEVNATKFKAFGKVKVRNKKTDGKLEKLLKEKDSLLKGKNYVDEASTKEIDNNICEELKQRQKKSFEKELKHLRDTKERKGNSAVIFGLKDKIIGKKKDGDEPSSIIDPKTNREVFKPKEIVSACADYVENLLTNKVPKEEFQLNLEWKKRIHSVRMEETDDSQSELTREMFETTLKELKKKGSRKYQSILKAGNSLLNAIFRLFQVVWKTEDIPELWRETTVIKMFKGKGGDKRDLNYQRFIHTKKEYQKAFSHIVTKEIKPIVVDSISSFQIGAIPGHRSQEHLYTIKSAILLIEKNESAIGVQLLDLIKYFDSENLIDNMDELYKGNVKGKLYRLVYELNKKTNVKVRTAVGDSEERVIDDIVAQGSKEAGLISSQSLSKGVEDFFSTSECEVSYASLPLLPQSYQDDLARLCMDPQSAQLGNDRFEHLADYKSLTYNLKKSFIIIMGNKKAREKLITEFEEHPPTLYGEPVQLADHQTYLGDELGFNVSESISLTINKRIGLAKMSIMDIKTIVEDIRSNVSGGIKTGLLLWESCTIPFLLNNSSVWLRMKKKDMDRLDKIQNLFLNTLLATFNCPISLMYWDLAILTMHHRILKEKLNLYFHIMNLPENSLSRNFIEIQHSLHLPGIREEISEFLNRHEITNIRGFSKKDWKLFINKAIDNQNREYLIESSKKYKKINYLSLSEEDYGMKEYFLKYNLNMARIKFKERSNTMSQCKMHYPSDKNNLKTLFLCPEGCMSFDTLLHWRSCRNYSHFRENRNLNIDYDLLKYYQDVIDLRRREQENKQK